MCGMRSKPLQKKGAIRVDHPATGSSLSWGGFDDPRRVRGCRTEARQTWISHDSSTS